MKRNVLVEMATKNPGCDIILVLTGTDIPTPPLIEAAEAVLESKVRSTYNAGPDSGIRLMAVDKCDGLESVRNRNFEFTRTTKGWPHIRVPADYILMYLFDVKDMITLETMCSDNVVEIVDMETTSPDTKILMSGVNMLPICMGNMQIHKVPVEPAKDDNIPEPLKLLCRMAVKSLFAMSNVHNVPAGFFENLAESFMLGPHNGRMDRYDMTFRGKEGSSSEEFTDLTIEQVFALYELRNTTTIQ